MPDVENKSKLQVNLSGMSLSNVPKSTGFYNKTFLMKMGVLNILQPALTMAIFKDVSETSELSINTANTDFLKLPVKSCWIMKTQ